MAWPEHVLWWQLYPLGFVGAPIRPEQPVAEVTHRLPRIEGWLDHLLGLGLNGLLLGPVFASETHGYDTVDHLRVDPRLGDDADFDRLLAACQERGIRVLLDGVFNHVGRGHPAFQDVVARGPASASAELFAIDWPEGWTRGDPVPVADFEGHGSLVALDHGSPAVERLVAEAMRHWLDRGIDGWRLDAAYAVPPSFWARVLPEVRARHPEAWFLGEVIHGDYAGFVRDSGVDTVTQYELWQGIWHGIADRNLWESAHAIRRHDALLRSFVPQTFVGNHDVTRIASAVGVERMPHALAVLLTVAGTPSVYAGDEWAWSGVKEERLGGDDAVRPEFPAAPPTADAVASDARDILRHTERLIALRRRNPWLHRAHTDVVEVTNATMVLRTATAEAAIVTALNVGDAAVRVPAGGLAEVVAGAARVDGGMLELPPRGWAVLGG
ncbi:MAG: DUF3459 domain-containing protein [Micrococcales bacterium]|nr:DUF3459 domain-containing protein [Micrococcales bacterium]